MGTKATAAAGRKALARKREIGKADPGKLTVRERRFVEAYLVSGNATRAAKEAGYSPKSAYSIGQRVLKKAEVAAALSVAEEKRSERTQIDADYVLTGINRAIQRCEQIQPVLDAKGDPVLVETPAGNTVPAFKFDSTAVLKGYELLGRHLKMFTDKLEHGGGVTVTAVDMTPDERAARIAQLYAENPALIALTPKASS